MPLYIFSHHTIIVVSEYAAIMFIVIHTSTIDLNT